MGKRAGQFLAETIASIKPRVCVTIQQRMRFFLYLYTNTHTHTVTVHHQRRKQRERASEKKAKPNRLTKLLTSETNILVESENKGKSYWIVQNKTTNQTIPIRETSPHRASAARGWAKSWTTKCGTNILYYFSFTLLSCKRMWTKRQRKAKMRSPPPLVHEWSLLQTKKKSKSFIYTYYIYIHILYINIIITNEQKVSLIEFTLIANAY